MPDATRAQVYSLWQSVVDMLEEADKYGRSNSKNVLGMLSTLIGTYKGDYLDELEAAASLYRSASASNVSPGVAAALLRPVIRLMCKSVVNRGNLSDDQSMFDEIYRYFIDNGQRVQGRAYSYGTPSAGSSNVGNNQILRLTTDQYNQPIENIYRDRKRALCVLDYQTGAVRGGEVLQLVGQTPPKDDLQRSGSGAEAQLVGGHAENCILQNASFSNFESTTGVPTSPSGITDWTSVSPTTVDSTTYEFDGTNYFRAAPSDSTPYALKIKASALLRQKISTIGKKLIEQVPYILLVMYNAEVGSGVGTLTARMGTASASVATSGLTGWRTLIVPGSGTLNQSCWYKNFAQDDLAIELQWARTSGNLLIDDVLFMPGTFHDGTWYWFVPKTVTSWIPNRVNDSYTWQDWISSDSKIQKWNDRGFRRYLPSSIGSSITLSDPS